MLKTKLTSLLTAAALMLPMLVIPAETASAKDTGTIRDMSTMDT